MATGAAFTGRWKLRARCGATARCAGGYGVNGLAAILPLARPEIAYLASTALSSKSPLLALTHLLNDPGAMTGREVTRANYFARADLSDPALLEKYLLSPNLSCRTTNLCRTFPERQLHGIPQPDAIRRLDRAALEVIYGWISDPRLQRPGAKPPNRQGASCTICEMRAGCEGQRRPSRQTASRESTPGKKRCDGTGGGLTILGKRQNRGKLPSCSLPIDQRCPAGEETEAFSWSPLDTVKELACISRAGVRQSEY